MSQYARTLGTRAERLLPRLGVSIHAHWLREGQPYRGYVENVSFSGLGVAFEGELSGLYPGSRLANLELEIGGQRFACGSGTLARLSPVNRGAGIAFDVTQSKLMTQLKPALRSYEYVTSELEADGAKALGPHLDASDYTLDMFQNKPSRDVFEKCRSFRPWVEDMQAKQLYQQLWRVTATGPLDHRITVFDPIRRCERSMVCFDSNSYLGLHLHPQVIERVQQVLRSVGYGTASSQMLCGTNRYLRELEDDLSDFLGREETIIFPTGFAANIGTISALVRKDDAIVRDRFAHASIHEGCRNSQAKFNRLFAHNNMQSLAKMLERADAAGCQGKLVVSDGVFSMHGRIAPLPQLVATAKTYDARLMIDDAHGLGVLGEHGRGLEEHFGMPGSVDVLMGTLSKALGAIGGFVSGSRDLVYYLRFYASSGLFTTSLPAATCAGLREALRIMRAEPEHRRRLWQNIRFLAPALRDAGFIVPDPESPITTVFMGTHTLMLEFSRDLFEAGIKCGNVMYPAVAKGESILRMTLNARHTEADLIYAVDTLTKLGKKWGILHRSADEIRDMGRSVRLRAAS